MTRRRPVSFSGIQAFFGQALISVWYIYFGPWGPRSPVDFDPGAFYGGVAKALAGVVVGVCSYKAYDIYMTQNES